MSNTPTNVVVNTPEIISIQNAEQRIGLMPALGGSVAYWDVMRSGETLALEWQPIWRRYGPSQDGRRIVGNFPLVPWSNRIAGGGFSFDGVFYPMVRNRVESFPIHGDGWMHAWKVTEHSDHSIELQMESRHHLGYPFEYTATQRYSIDGNDMVMRLAVTHLGDKPLPYGLAWHPFFLRGEDENGPRLQFRADGYWTTSPESLPLDHSAALPEAWDFNAMRTLGHGKIDHNFSGWDGRMRMERDDINLRIDWQTTEPANIDIAVLFRPENTAFFCFEPVTHITNAVNHVGMPGMSILKHGESMTLEVKQTLSRLKT